MLKPHPNTLSRSAAKAVSAALLGTALALGAAGAQAGTLAMPDSTNNRLVLFNDVDGSVLNANLFALAGGTPVHALGVGNEIWVSEQTGDRVSRWSASGTFLGQLGGAFAGGGLDNVRGMGLIGSTVYVTNAGSANGAPGAAVVMYGLSGNSLGNFSTATTAPSPFGVLAYQGGLLVSSSSADDDVHRYSATGGALGTFHNSATLNFAEQMAYALNGDILVAGFTSGNIVRLNATSGAVLATYAAPGARGVTQLGNGNILWSSGAGVSVLDVANGASTLVYAGGGRYLQSISPVPEPATVVLWASGLWLVGWRLRAGQRAHAGRRA